jgi:hypothetical protein
MKKVLVAGAALMLAGSMVSAASAEVNLSGDARVRYIGMTNAEFSDDLREQSGYQDKFNSRVRIKINATAKGGAYAKARLRLDDLNWNGQSDHELASDSKNAWVDYGYLGIPMGPVTVEGGQMRSGYSEFFDMDNEVTRIKLDYKAGGIRVIGLYDIKSEKAADHRDEWDDNDVTGWGLIASFDINDEWLVKGYARYEDNQRDYNAAGGSIGDEDSSGFLGSIYAQGKVAVVEIETELAYMSSDVQQQYSTGGRFIDDDGLGGYLQVSLDMGAFTPGCQVGFTQNGYQADIDFGFIMIGADEPITAIETLGTYGGDTYWAALTTGFQVSEELRLAGNLVYYDIDLNDAVLEDADDIRGAMDAWEISGSATYTVSEGADITYKIGYLDQSYDGRINAAGVSEDGIFGHYLRLAVKF